MDQAAPPSVVRKANALFVLTASHVVFVTQEIPVIGEMPGA